MKRIIPFLVFVILWGNLSAQLEQDSAWIKDNYSKTEEYITMRDGVRLFTAVYTPKNQSEKHPILITRTPYSCSPYGTEFSERMWLRWRYYDQGPITILLCMPGF